MIGEDCGIHDRHPFHSTVSACTPWRIGALPAVWTISIADSLSKKRVVTGLGRESRSGFRPGLVRGPLRLHGCTLPSKDLKPDLRRTGERSLLGPFAFSLSLHFFSSLNDATTLQRLPHQFVTMASGKEVLEDFLKTNGSIKYIRLQWMDYSGVLRARFVPTDRCLRIASGHENACMVQAGMLVPISTAPRIFSISDYHETWFLRPDWSSLRVCGFKPDHAAVMSFVDQNDAKERFDKCPRNLLVRALERLEKNWGAKVLLGFEIEFVLLDESNNVTRRLDRLNGYSRIAGLRAETLDLIEEIVEALKLSAVSIHQFHAEAGEQLEIALAPESALKAVDSLVLAQETIRTICVRRGIKATMTPKPVLGGDANGIHVHLSLDKLDGTVAGNFLAGVLQHMTSLCAFGMANYDGYDRSVADCAGEWIGYGTDNRDLPVRKVSHLHWEIRIMDGTANPYLFTACVLLAALDGLESKTELSWRDLTIFPHLLDEKKRIGYGINKHMPVTFAEALDALRNDTVLKTQIGEDLLKWYLHVKDKDVEEFGKMTEEQRRLCFLGYF